MLSSCDPCCQASETRFAVNFAQRENVFSVRKNLLVRKSRHSRSLKTTLSPKSHDKPVCLEPSSLGSRRGVGHIEDQLSPWPWPISNNPWVEGRTDWVFSHDGWPNNHPKHLCTCLWRGLLKSVPVTRVPRSDSTTDRTASTRDIFPDLLCFAAVTFS